MWYQKKDHYIKYKKIHKQNCLIKYQNKDH